MLFKNSTSSLIPVSLAFLLTALQTVQAGGMEHEARQNMEHRGHGDHGEESASYGSPGDPAKADQVIEITAVDIAFRPTSIKVRPGETVKFIVTNKGRLQHEFVLGPESEQMTHNSEMQGLSPDEMARHMEGDRSGIVIPPGQTQEITWTFSDNQDQLQYACHVPGHYEAGMHGAIRLSTDGA